MQILSNGFTIGCLTAIALHLILPVSDMPNQHDGVSKRMFMIVGRLLISVLHGCSKRRAAKTSMCTLSHKVHFQLPCMCTSLRAAIRHRPPLSCFETTSSAALQRLLPTVGDTVLQKVYELCPCCCHPLQIPHAMALQQTGRPLSMARGRTATIRASHRELPTALELGQLAAMAL
jgi:hypothetical protein